MRNNYNTLREAHNAYLRIENNIEKYTAFRAKQEAYQEARRRSLNIEELDDAVYRRDYIKLAKLIRQGNIHLIRHIGSIKMPTWVTEIFNEAWEVWCHGHPLVYFGGIQYIADEKTCPKLAALRAERIKQLERLGS